jgi:hypothetical protein
MQRKQESRQSSLLKVDVRWKGEQQNENTEERLDIRSRNEGERQYSRYGGKMDTWIRKGIGKFE